MRPGTPTICQPVAFIRRSGTSSKRGWPWRRQLTQRVDELLAGQAVQLARLALVQSGGTGRGRRRCTARSSGRGVVAAGAGVVAARPGARPGHRWRAARPCSHRRGVGVLHVGLRGHLPSARSVGAQARASVRPAFSRGRCHQGWGHGGTQGARRAVRDCARPASKHERARGPFEDRLPGLAQTRQPGRPVRRHRVQAAASSFHAALADLVPARWIPNRARKLPSPKPFGHPCAG